MIDIRSNVRAKKCLWMFTQRPDLGKKEKFAFNCRFTLRGSSKQKERE
jgi:hypothetical protein